MNDSRVYLPMLTDFALLEFGLGFVSSFLLTIIGIKVRNRVLAVRVLSGVKSEVEENRADATTIIKDLSEDIKSDQIGEERRSRSTPELSTSAYDNFIDSGHINILPDELQEQLQTHYSEIRMLNRELRDREKRVLGTEGNSGSSPSHDDGGTVLDMLVICSEKHQEEILDEVDDSPVTKAVTQLRQLIQIGQAQESDTAKRDDIDFDSISKGIEQDLDTRRLSP